MTIRIDQQRGSAASRLVVTAKHQVGSIAPASRNNTGRPDKSGRCYADLRRWTRARLRAVKRQNQIWLTDLLMAGCAFSGASIINRGFDRELTDFIPTLVQQVPWFVLVCAVVFPFTCLYSRNWRYASAADMLGIIQAALVATLAAGLLLYASERLVDARPSVLLVEVMCLVALLGAVRIRPKLADWWQYRRKSASMLQPREDTIPVIIIGAGDAADLYLRALQRDGTSRHRPVGILDTDDPVTEGFMLRGVPILGGAADFETVVAELERRGEKPRHVIFTEPVNGFTDPVVESLIDQADRLGVAISRPAPVLELRHPRAEDRFELRPIQLTDLLQRPQAALDRAALSRMITGRRIIVTGAGGSIGSELVQQVAELKPAELIMVENCEYNLYSIDLTVSEKFPLVRRKSYICDVRDALRLTEIFGRHKPDLVFHAAALKHVPMVELNPCEGVLTNVIGTMNVADATRACGAAAMVQISTDKVVNTTNVMGATKRLAELYCQALDLEAQSAGSNLRFITVRFGNVLGSSGSLIPLFKRQIARGGPLTVTDPEMKRFFMTIREAVELTLQASAYGLEKKLGQGEIFVLDMGEPIKIMDMARRMIALAGYKPDETIRIEVVGRRPGEKLFEELFDAGEKRVESRIPGVLGAVPNPVPLSTLRTGFSRLRLLAKSGDADAVIATLSELLPGYRREEARVSDAATEQRPPRNREARPLPAAT